MADGLITFIAAALTLAACDPEPRRTDDCTGFALAHSKDGWSGEVDLETFDRLLDACQRDRDREQNTAPEKG